MKTYRKYKGVKIFRIKEEVPDIRELKNGELKEGKKPIVIDTSYKFHESYPYDSLQDCKDAIDRLWKKLNDVYNEKEFALVMNEG